MPYRSTVDGVCHACGHDVHTTVLLGVGMLLAQLAERGELPGRVRLIFQPAEEILPVRRARGDRGRRARRTSPRSSRCTAPRSCRSGWSALRAGPITAAADKVRSGSPARAGTPPART